jgi:hypothetical protein
MYRTISLLLLLSLATCHSGDEKKNTTIPVKQILTGATLRYEPPRDGKAEVARYQFTRGHYGIKPEGIAMLLIVREGVNKNTYVKTEKGGLPAIKIMSLKTLPIMNWNDRENSGMYSGDDLTPLRLSITAEEWCGNNYLEWVSRGDKAHLIGRSYIEDMVPKDEDVSLQKGYYLYEQMPLLVRAMVTGEPTAKIRLIVPQSAYLQPSEEELSVTLSRKEEAKITVPAGTFETVLIEVSADKPNPKFPAPERYWLEKKEHFIVKAERNEVHSEFGKFKAERGQYALLDIHRIPYWEKAIPPLQGNAASVLRATYDNQLEIDFFKIVGDKFKGGFNVDTFLQSPEGKNLPPEYISDPKGQNRVAKERDNKGGWFYDLSQNVGGKPGRFVPNVPSEQYQPKSMLDR